MPHGRIPIPLPAPNHDPFELFKAAIKFGVAEEQALDDPEDLTHKPTL